MVFNETNTISNKHVLPFCCTMPLLILVPFSAHRLEYPPYASRCQRKSARQFLAPMLRRSGVPALPAPDSRTCDAERVGLGLLCCPHQHLNTCRYLPTPPPTTAGRPWRGLGVARRSLALVTAGAQFSPHFFKRSFRRRPGADESRDACYRGERGTQVRRYERSGRVASAKRW